MDNRTIDEVRKNEDRLINKIELLEKENQELKKQLEAGEQQYNDLVEKKEGLQEQLDYLRSGEYINQLRFERDMLQDIVDKGEVSKEDKEFIDCTHRNTELLEQQKEFIEWLENLLTNELGVFTEVKVCDVLSKYKEILDNKGEYLV